MGWWVLPFGLAMVVFIVATIGFFVTEEKIEMLYGGCSIASLACAIVQLALLF